MPNKKYPLHGRFIDDESIDEKTKLIRYPNVKVLPENWELVNFASLADNNNNIYTDIAAEVLKILGQIGVKIISSNIALTGISAFPTYTNYVPQNRERLLLIAQTDPTQNGFYEWQTGGNLVRLWDIRDLENLGGININGKNIKVDLLNEIYNFLHIDPTTKTLYARISPTTDAGLELDANGNLKLNHSALPGAGGVSIDDVPHPDIDNVTGSNVLLVGASGTINVNGGNFRRDNTLISDGFTVTSYVNRGWNINSAVVQATNLIGIHNILSKATNLDSENTGDRTFTVLGAAIIDTVTPNAKRNATTVITVTGEGFALLSQFAANNAGITISNLVVTNRLLVQISVAVTNAVNSGNYNLTCTNSFGGNTFTSGTSGNGKLIIFGDPSITSVWRNFAAQYLAEIFLGETVTIDARGFDLTNEASINPSGITVNSVSGTSTQKNISVTGSSNKADIGIKNLLITDTPNSSNSGTSGNGKLALNHFYSSTVFRKPTTFRAFGGAVLSDWVITQNANDITIERIGGSGMAFLEITDLFLVASLLDFSLGWLSTRVDFVVETLANNLDTSDGCYISIGAIGTTLTNPRTGVDYWANICQSNTTPSFYAISNPSFNQTVTSVPNVEIDISRNGVVGQNTRFVITNNNTNMSNGTLTRNFTSHANKSVFVAMQANYRMRLSLKGWIGD
jgi:hypothetical protein